MQVLSENFRVKFPAVSGVFSGIFLILERLFHYDKR